MKTWKLFRATLMDSTFQDLDFDVSIGSLSNHDDDAEDDAK